MTRSPRERPSESSRETVMFWLQMLSLWWVPLLLVVGLFVAMAAGTMFLAQAIFGES